MTITISTLIVAVIILMICILKLNSQIKVLRSNISDIRSVSGYLRQDVDYAIGDIICLTDRIDKVEQSNPFYKKYPDELRDKAVDMMLKDGKSTRQVSSELNIPQRTVAGWLLKEKKKE